VSSSDTGDADAEPRPVSAEEFDHELRSARALLDPKDPPDSFFVVVQEDTSLNSRQVVQTDEPAATDAAAIYALLAGHIEAVAETTDTGFVQAAAMGVEVAKGLYKRGS
jgi:hypothetical protein